MKKSNSQDFEIEIDEIKSDLIKMIVSTLMHNK